MEKTGKLPYGFERRDSVMGTVVQANRQGVRILLDACGEETGPPLYAFAFCDAPIGSRALVSIRYFSKSWNSFVSELDSIWTGKLPTAHIQAAA